MKKNFLVALVILMLAALFGCDSNAVKHETAEPELTDITSALLESEIFGEPLAKVDSEVGIAVYELAAGDVMDSQFYMSTGATAEELSAFKASSAEAAKRINTAIEARIDFQSASYASYGPDEVPKLENAIVKTSGTTVVFCVSSDFASAKEIIDALF